MLVREILSLVHRQTVIKVYQTAIKAFGCGDEPVLRQYASVGDLLSSNQNYLDYEVIDLRQEEGIMTLTCKANKEQENKVLRSWYEGRGGYVWQQSTLE